MASFSWSNCCCSLTPTPSKSAATKPAVDVSIGASENFVLATRKEVAATMASADPARVLRGVLGIALLLKRTVILPPGGASDALLNLE